MRDEATFIDWLSMYQVHRDGGLPVINDGCVWSVDQVGEVEWTTDRRFKCEGSHASSVQLRCDGFRVEVSGNIGRFNRPDNVFGFGYDQCVDKWNELLNVFGLPPFTRGTPHFLHGAGVVWSGAINTRIDLCRNVATFSQANLRRLMAWLGGRQHSRMKVGVVAEGETVEWGRGSKYAYQKFYNKLAEMRYHVKRGTVYDADVLALVEELGLGREEISLKSRFLTQRLLRFYGVTTMTKLVEVYRERSQLTDVGRSFQFDDIESLPKAIRSTLLAWRNGLDWSQGLSARTQRRHRSYLKDVCGVDISVPHSIERMPIRPREVEFAVAVAPDWYVDRYSRIPAIPAELVKQKAA